MRRKELSLGARLWLKELEISRIVVDDGRPMQVATLRRAKAELARLLAEKEREGL